MLFMGRAIIALATYSILGIGKKSTSNLNVAVTLYLSEVHRTLPLTKILWILLDGK